MIREHYPRKKHGKNTDITKRKILLISPFSAGLDDPIAYPPLGLLYLASNMNTKFIPDILIMESETFVQYDYEVYGISVHSVGVVKFVSNLIAEIHKKNPKATFIVGGAGSGLIPRATYIIHLMGEGEKFFDVDTKNLDNINFPARYLVDSRFIVKKDGSHHTPQPSTTMIATRGCPYSCAFCDRETHGRKLRKRSFENIVREIKQLKLMYGIKWIRFVDDCITVDKKWFINLCLELKDLDIKWTVLSRSDCVDLKLLKLMYRCGCREIFFGFESGSQKILNLMRKHNTVQQNIEVIKLCREAKIISCAYMMFGFPGEDAETVRETVSFLQKAKPDKSRLTTFIPIPGSDVWNYPEKYGIKIRENYDDYWCFDKHDFACIYRDVSTSKMRELRDKLMQFYVDAGYKKNWQKAAV